MKQIKRISKDEWLVALLLALILPLIVFPFQVLTAYIQEFLRWEPAVKNASGVLACFLTILTLALVQSQLSSSMRVENEGADMLLFALSRGVKPHYLKALIVCFLACLCSFAMGLALGGEAPCVYMGALLGAWLSSRLAHKKRHELKEGIVMGAGTGFSLAFMNPLAGFLMQLSLKKHRDHRFLLTFLCSCLGYLELGILRGFFLHLDNLSLFYQGFLYDGMNTSFLAFDFAPLTHCWIFVLIPVAAMLLALVYVYTSKYARLYLRKMTPWHHWSMLAVGVLLCFFLRLYLPEVLGTGSSLIESSLGICLSGVLYSLLLLALRFLLTEVSIAGPFAGGPIVPTLALGALSSALITSLLNFSLSLSDSEILLSCLIGALSFFAFTTKKPLVSLSLLLSFVPGFVPFLAMIPSFILASIYWRFAPFISLAQAIGKADIANGIKMDIMYGHHLHSHFFHGDLLGEEFYEERK